jgi:CO/xanthine dehydrogenase Mo-binding subunit
MFDVTGVRLREVPFTPERVLSWIEESVMIKNPRA